MRVLSLLLASFIFLLSPSCKTTRVIQTMYSDVPAVIQFKNTSKTVQFIPMHHVGKPIFYNNVKDLIRELKRDGYTVYYEFVEVETQTDSTTLDTYKRKFRKLVGFQLDTGGYASALHSRGLFKTLINQPAYSFFGVDSSDHRADVTADMIVDAYEKKFGTIELDESDRSLPLDGVAVVGKNRLPSDRVMNILIDYRNSVLANLIQNSNDQKIMVVYGAQHLEGTFARLRELDPGWVKN